jgi:hypothetical protein
MTAFEFYEVSLEQIERVPNRARDFTQRAFVLSGSPAD